MKEAEIFENWINNLSEGTWALPETPEQMQKLNQLMSAELIVGPDATNATEQLYDIVGDDELFDILNDLADKSEGRANCWDDSDVQRRLAELGIQTPQSTQAEPANVKQDTAPEVKEAFPSKRGGQGRLRDALEDDPDMMGYHAIAALYGPQMWDNDAMGDLVYDLEQATPTPEELQYIIVNAELPGRLKSIRFTNTDDVQFGHMDEGDNRATFVEDRELAEMLKYAGVPIKEGVLNDSTGSTLSHIQDRFRRDIKDFTETGDMSDDLYDALYDYYFDDMPYGTKKARTGDPHEWVADRFASDLGINENLISPMIMPVSEGSCNMTMEGSYCPEHGLAKCGSMYEDSRSRTVPPRPNIQDTPRTKSVAGAGRGVVNPAPVNSMDDSIPHIEIRGFGPDFEDLPAGKKLINPMQPRRHNELSPLKSGDSTPLSKVANVDLTMDEDGGAVGMPYSMGEGVYDPDYRGGYNNEFDELEDLLSKSGMSQDDLMRQRFLASKHGLNTPADMSKLPALKKDAETGYVARKAALDADLEKRNQQYMQDKLTDLEYQQDPVAFLKRRTQQLTPTAPTPPTAATAPDAPADVAATPGTDYSLPRAKLGSSPSARLPNFRPDSAAEVPAPSDQTDTRNQKSSMFQQLAQLRNRTRGNMAETSNDDPINSNSAMTGAYYEGKETPTQEGDALLARIKSLALLR